MKRVRVLVLLAAWLFVGTAAFGQFQSGTDEKKLGTTREQKWEAGLTISAPAGPIRGISATLPVPIDWPEQSVKIVDEAISPNARVRYKMVGATAKLMVIEIPYLARGEKAQVAVTFEVKRSSQLPPENTDEYFIPERRKLSRAVLPYLGSTPNIDARYPKIRSLAKKIVADQDLAWEKVEAIYDHTRAIVEHRDTLKVKGAQAALRDGHGNHEDLACLFIALCRASSIPARTVWIHEHCYPEFYLVDDEKKGHWFPCQVAGTRSFGDITEHRVILFKGDLYRPPHNPREQQRFPAVHLKATSNTRPSFNFFRRPVSK